MGSTIFGFGLGELIMIAMLVLILFKPENLPGMFRSFGGYIRKFRNWYVVLAAQIQQELEPVQEELKEIRQVAHEVRHDLEEIRSAVVLSAMLPPMVTEPLEQIAAPATIETPAAQQVVESVGSIVQPEHNGHTHNEPAPQAKAGLHHDNPWVGGSVIDSSKKPKLSEDNPWGST